MMPGMADAAACDLLFVYGTLRRGFRLHSNLTRLGASFRGEAKVAGELFALGLYPGARPADEEGKWVHGELFHLQKPEHDVALLDEVEGFDPQAPLGGEFVRARAEVILEDGTPQRAWIYWLSPKAPATRRIASGDYATSAARAELT
jgi:gamma-glutamylcyclotransferase (GGCT)/AIG2-like uncharacterized protein YtfP